MRIVFVGTVKFSLIALETLVFMGENVVGVITKSNSTFNSDFADLVPLCQEYEIPYKFSTDVNDKYTVNWIRSLKPDVIFCVGWSNLLGKEILNIAPKGVIGFHPAKLPQNRGRHPLIWALVLGLEETASTFFFIDEGTDSGDIVSQEIIPICDYDNAGSLYYRIGKVMAGQLRSFVPKLRCDTLIAKSQKHSKANIWRKRTKEDGKIDFRMGSRLVYNLVRALADPYVNAHFIYKEEEIKVISAALAHASVNTEPGKVLLREANRILVKCGTGAILLTVKGKYELPEEGEYL